ncbi:probable protein phosphatase 2C 38 [Salvia splendens]|uniref:probable protein phosphatase 2C 38 n=1 Tax=Salvia splendens TaxID=180675 RepID=UPI001C2552C3|nr:probable protein phosphatase 2C 38 [Salvia splendens]
MSKMGTNSWRKYVSPCWRPSVESRAVNCNNRGGNPSGCVDGLWWYKDIAQHIHGEFSMAVIQANNVLEDQCQVESGPMSSMEAGPRGTFVGIYDGHAGPEASQFINNHLFKNIKRYTLESQEMSADVIKSAYLATEDQFLSMVKKQWEIKPQLASVGSCCLVGIVCNGMIYTANAGDSRVVLARLEKSGKEVKAVQLSDEHNASFESVREELRSLHPEDLNIVVLKHKVWRVKGLIQISRSIGDAYLKKAEFNKPPLLAKFRIPDPIEKPILLAEPSIQVQKLQHEDQFLIYASDGLWEHLSNQEAVDIVHHSPRNGVAKKLVKAALQEAALKREVRYSDLERIDRGVRRHFHDDITVIVLFLDSHLISRSSFQGPILSIKGGG